MEKEKIEEAAEKYHNKISKKRNTQLGVPSEDFIEGAKWQQERMYSEEDMIAFGKFCHNDAHSSTYFSTFKLLLEQFKKKK
jgi:hypothetical protein